jgi:thioredoxin 1
MNSEEFNAIVKQSEGLVVVDFSASWCMPCKLIAPAFDEMSKSDGEFPGVTFIKIDVDEVPGNGFTALGAFLS